MPSKERAQQILEILTNSGRVDVEGLVSLLGISPATVRRELARLQQQGLLKRDRGGAYLPVPITFAPFLDDFTYANQIQQMSAEKTRIGALVASLVHDGETVGLAPGTTTTHVAGFLKQRSNLTVVTNAVNIAMELSRNRDFIIHLTGGRLSGDWFALVGHRALQAVPEIRMDCFIFGANGVSVEHGITDRHIEEAAVNRAMLKLSRRNILVADHMKLEQVAQYLVCPARDVDTIVTDSGSSQEIIGPFQKAGIQVLLA